MKNIKRQNNKYKIELIVEDKYTGDFDKENILLEYNMQDLKNELRNNLNGMFLKVKEMKVTRI